MAIPLAGMAIFFFWQWWNGGITPGDAYDEVRQTIPSRDRAELPPPATGSSRSAPVVQQALPKVTPKSPHRQGGEIVLIIDDLGFDGQPLDRIMALDPNVNCAILPNGTRAAEFARTLHARGFEILCHLPMQPRGNASPGRDAILTSMTDEEIERLTRANVEAIPHARGVNNHMGSLATADARVMHAVLRSLPDGMYFIDSRTTGNSVAGATARAMNVRSAARHVFLDDLATEAAVRKQVAELASVAEERGIAIGIGHPYAVTLRVLEQELPLLKAKGFRLIRASAVVR